MRIASLYLLVLVCPPACLPVSVSLRIVNATSTQASLAPGVDQLLNTNNWSGTLRVYSVQRLDEAAVQLFRAKCVLSQAMNVSNSPEAEGGPAFQLPEVLFDNRTSYLKLEIWIWTKLNNIMAAYKYCNKGNDKQKLLPSTGSSSKNYANILCS